MKRRKIMDKELEIVANEGIQDVVTEVAKPNKTQQYLGYAAGAAGCMLLGAALCLAVEYGIKFFNAKKAAKQTVAEEPNKDEEAAKES